jgi:hypothetical protein
MSPARSSASRSSTSTTTSSFVPESSLPGAPPPRSVLQGGAPSPPGHMWLLPRAWWSTGCQGGERCLHEPGWPTGQRLGVPMVMKVETEVMLYEFMLSEADREALMSWASDQRVAHFQHHDAYMNLGVHGVLHDVCLLRSRCGEAVWVATAEVFTAWPWRTWRTRRPSTCYRWLLLQRTWR